MRRAAIIFGLVVWIAIGLCFAWSASQSDHEAAPATTSTTRVSVRPTTTASLPPTTLALVTVPPTTAAPTTTVPVTSPSPPTTIAVPPILPADGADYHTWWDWPLWSALHQCEEGADTFWTTNGPVYVSGLGMYVGTYNTDARQIGLNTWGQDHSAAPGWQPPSIAEQILVGRQGHYVNHNFWGCGKRVKGW